MINTEFKADCRALFENLNEGVAVVNFLGEFRYFNEAACKIFELTDNSLINKSIYDFVRTDSYTVSEKSATIPMCAREVLRAQISGLSSSISSGITADNRIEFEFVSQGGKRKFLVLSLSPYFEAKPICSGSVTTDSLTAEGSATGSGLDSAVSGSDSAGSEETKGVEAGRRLVGVTILISDITLQKNFEIEIRHRLELEKIISEISSDFVHLDLKDLDTNINKAIRKVGQFAHVDRSYIFLFSENKLFCDNTHEWCNEGVTSEIENLKGIPVEYIPWWMSKLRKSESIHIPLVSALPPEASTEKETLEAQGIKSLLVLPLLSADDLIGFIGFDSVNEVKSWNHEDISLLNILGDIFGNAFVRLKAKQQLIKLNGELEQKVEERTWELKALLEFNRTIVENVDLIVFTTDNKGVINFMNPYSVKRLGYSADDIIGKQTPLLFYFNNSGSPAWTQPEAAGSPAEPAAAGRSIIGGEWKLKTCGGELFDALVTVSRMEDRSGKVTGYVHVAIDITERMRNEYYAALQRELGFALAATSTIDQALNQVIEAVTKLNGIDAAGIYLINDKTEDLELAKYIGISETLAQSVNFYGKSDERYLLLTAGNTLFGNYEEIVKKKNPLLLKEGFKQIGVFQIKFEGKVIGSLNIASKVTGNISELEKINIEIIASQIGGTLSRIKAEDALNKSRENFKLMFDTIDDFLFILDAKGNIIKTNPVVRMRLGYTKEELEGMNVLEVHPPLQREEAFRIVNDMLARREEMCPIPLYTKDGRQIQVETKVVAGKWDGEAALYGISRDVSERVEAQKALTESEVRLNFALESTGDGVWDWNIAENTVYYSSGWKSMLGYTDDDISNNIEEWTSRVHPDDLPKAMADTEKHIAGETEVYVNEHRLRCKDGSFKWILDRGKVVEWDNSGKPLRITGIHTDITFRKELEMLKSRFVSMASHEFRTPLASILLISETLLSYYYKLSREEQNDRLRRIKEHVLHLTNIVNDVLQLSRIQEGRVAYSPMLEDIVALCSNISEQFSSLFVPQNKIEFTHEGLEVLTVMVDKNLFTRALENLLTNAVKYSGPQPKIKLRLKIGGGEWIVEVEDNGIGIPPADRKHIFTPFFRAGNVSTIQGNGLGLSIVKEAVQMHKGRVNFESKYTVVSDYGSTVTTEGNGEGHSTGTTFSMHFPL